MDMKGSGSTRLAPLTIVVLIAGVLYVLPSKALLVAVALVTGLRADRHSDWALRAS